MHLRFHSDQVPCICLVSFNACAENAAAQSSLLILASSFDTVHLTATKAICACCCSWHDKHQALPSAQCTLLLLLLLQLLFLPAVAVAKSALLTTDLQVPYGPCVLLSERGLHASARMSCTMAMKHSKSILHCPHNWTRLKHGHNAELSALAGDL